MTDQLNGRTICVLRGSDPRQDLNALADAIIEAAEIFLHNGALVWLNDGQLVRVTNEVLCEIIREHVVTRRLVNRDGKWLLEYPSLMPSTAKALGALLRNEKLEEGSLLARAPPA